MLQYEWYFYQGLDSIFVIFFFSFFLLGDDFTVTLSSPLWRLLVIGAGVLRWEAGRWGKKGSLLFVFYIFRRVVPYLCMFEYCVQVKWVSRTILEVAYTIIGHSLLRIGLNYTITTRKAQEESKLMIYCSLLNEIQPPAWSFICNDYPWVHTDDWCLKRTWCGSSNIYAPIRQVMPRIKALIARGSTSRPSTSPPLHPLSPASSSFLPSSPPLARPPVV